MRCTLRSTAVDVVWALDESTSIAETAGLFDEVTAFAAEMIRCDPSQPICTTLVNGSPRHSIITFAGQSYFEPDLYSDIGLNLGFDTRAFTQLLPPLASRVAQGGFTRTDKAFDAARARFVANGSLTRRKVFILLTDGLPTDEFGFPGSPLAMNRTLTSAAALLSGSYATLIWIRVGSRFPTGNDQPYLAQFSTLSLDFHATKHNPQNKNTLLNSIFPCP
jgi:hypothetical protein